MKFYRVVEESDFKKAEKEFSEFPMEAKELIIIHENIAEAKRLLFEKYGYSNQQARVVCDDYLAYLKAKSDFRKGKTVYTEY